MTKFNVWRPLAIGLVASFSLFGARVLTLRMTGLDIPPDHASSVPPLPAPTAYRSTAQSDATLKQFESSVLKFIVLHEIGHMVADTYAADAPMIGNPEDAADRFAAFVLTRNNDDPDVARRRQANAVSSQILLSARAYWRGRYRLEQGNEGQPLEFGDTHLLNPQRAELIGCLLYGSNPDDYAALADELGMDPDRRASCRVESMRNRDAWNRVIQNHLASSLDDQIDAGLATGEVTFGATVGISYLPVSPMVPEPTRTNLIRARETAESDQILEFAASVIGQLKSPRRLTASGPRMTQADVDRLFSGTWQPSTYDYHVISADCLSDSGQPIENAAWVQSERTLVLCHAFVNSIENIGKSLLVEQSGEQRPK